MATVARADLCTGLLSWLVTVDVLWFLPTVAWVGLQCVIVTLKWLLLSVLRRLSLIDYLSSLRGGG